MNKQVIINNLNTSKKNCVIVSVGDGSLHRQLCYDTLILICICLFMTILIISILGIQSLYVN